jgi:predicted MFS family arabinose efflux permease
MPWALLAAGGLAMFAASASGSTRAPFLLDMARDLDTSLPLIANIMAVTSIAWGAASLVAGAWSDRVGRRPFLVGAPIALALSLWGVARSDSFAEVMLWATRAGASTGSYTGIVVTEIAARTENRQRGRALGWAMSGQSLALLVGVPGGAWIGSFVGWRGVSLCVGAIAIASSLGLFATTIRPVGAAAPTRGARVGYAAALSPPVLRLLAMGVAERTCYGVTVVFFATFLQATYGLSLAGVAIPLALFAAGNICGTVIGGQLADRLANRLHTYAAAMLTSAGLSLVLFSLTAGVAASVALGFCYVFAIAVARPSLMASLANVPDDVRGTVLGLNVASASMGWLGASALGGWIMAQFGFVGFGFLTASVAVMGGALALWRRH